MRTRREETQVEHLHEEIRRLRALLAGREQTAELLARTERKVAVQTHELASTREELEQQARLFDTVLSSIVDFAYIFDRAGRFTYINQALLDLWQMRLEDAVGKTFFELPYPHELAARLHEQIETVFLTGQSLRDETPYTGAAGVTGYYEYIFVPVFDKDGQVKVVAGSTRDITQRAQAQAEKEALFKTLQVERQRLTTLFQQAPAFIAVVRGPEHVFEMANPLYLQLVGHRELAGKSVRQAFPEMEGQGFFEILDAVYRTGEPFVGNAMPIRFQEHADAPVRERYIDFVYQPLQEADGSISGIFVHGVDLTERIQAEQALHASQERVRLATEAAGLGIWTWQPDRDGVVWENARMYEIYALSPDDEPLTSAQFLAECVHPDDADAFVRAIAAPVQTGAPLHFIGRFFRRDGALRWIEFWGRRQPPLEGERLCVVGTAADITERKEAEQQLQARAREIGLLNDRLRRAMRETHHRVKNNLQVISAMAEMQTEGKALIPVTAMHRVGQHARTLATLHDLLTQEAALRPEVKTVSAQAALAKLAPLLKAAAGGRKVECASDDFALPVTECGSLTMLISELVSNAIKHGAGDIEVSLRSVGEQVRLQVSDQGPGFPPGFDPVRAAHTGLDLIVMLARHDLRGSIAFENAPDEGARVTVNFAL